MWGRSSAPAAEPGSSATVKSVKTSKAVANAIGRVGSGALDEDMMIDYSNVETDQELLDELAALSGTSAPAAARAPAKAAVPAAPRTAAPAPPKTAAPALPTKRLPAADLDSALASAQLLVRAHVDEADTEDIELTEDDMRDPALLGELAMLSGDPMDGIPPPSSSSARAAPAAAPVSRKKTAEPAEQPQNLMRKESADAPDVTLEQKLKTNNKSLLETYIVEERTKAKAKIREDKAAASVHLANSKKLQARLDALTAAPAAAAAAPAAAAVAKRTVAAGVGAPKAAPARAVAASLDGDGDAMVPLQDLPREAAFDKMEATLSDHVTKFHEASTRLLKQGDKDEAVVFHKERKLFVQALEYVKNVRAKGGDLPTYSYVPRTFTMQQSFPDIHEQEIEIHVVRGISLPLPKDYKDLDTFVNVEMGFPDEHPQVFKTETVKGVDGSYECVKRFRIERNRAFGRFLERRKITFEVVHNKGFLWGTAPLAKGTVELKHLLTQCEVHEVIELKDDKNSRVKCGRLEVRVRLRAPLNGPEIRTISENFLFLDAFAPAAAVTAPKVALPAAVKPPTSPAPAGKTAPPAKTQLPSPPPPQRAQPPAAKLQPAKAESTEGNGDDDEDDDDPESVDYMVSNEVLDAALKQCETKIKVLEATRKPVPAELADKLENIKIKMNDLSMKAEMGLLTMEVYMDMVKKAIAEEKQRALKFKQANKLVHAKAAMERLKSMQKEVDEVVAAQAAEEASEGGESAV